MSRITMCIEGNGVGKVLGSFDLNKYIENIKIDICREFAEKVKEKFKNDYTATAVEISIAINEVLAEIESENSILAEMEEELWKQKV